MEIEEDFQRSLLPGTVYRFSNCKKAGFPICLNNALKEIFHNDDMIMNIAKGAGFKERKVQSTRDIWGIYLDFLSALQKTFEKDASSVIEFKVLEKIQLMKCYRCPVYELESQRQGEKYVNPLPNIAGLLHGREIELSEDPQKDRSRSRAATFVADY